MDEVLYTRIYDERNSSVAARHAVISATIIALLK